MAVQDRATRRILHLAVAAIALLVGIVAGVQLVRGVVALAGPGPEVTFVAETPLDRVESTVPVADAEQFLSAEQRSALDAQRRSDVRETVAAGAVLVLAGALLALNLRRARRSG